MLFNMIILTAILLILSTFTMVGSAYYSDKNYKLGKLLWRTSMIIGVFYSVSSFITIATAVCKLIEFLF